ncbi:hypothetical protein HID58_024524, partial [Brassica napus]
MVSLIQKFESLPHKKVGNFINLWVVVFGNLRSKMAAITESVDSGVGEGIENSLESDQVKKLNPEAKEFIPSYKKKNKYQSLSSGDFAITKKQSGVEEFYKKDGSRRRNDYNNQGRKVEELQAQRDDSIRRTVYVSDIDQTVTEEVLAGLFSSYGQVVDCRICGDPNSVLRFAFVEFSDDQGARAALSVGGTVIGYHPVRVLPSKTAILPVNPTFLPRSEDEREKCTRTIYCTNVDKNATEDDVRISLSLPAVRYYSPKASGDQLHSTRILLLNLPLECSCGAELQRSSSLRISADKMRGAIGRRFSNPSNGFSLASIVKHTPFLIQPTSHFSSDGGAGRGRGRGGGSGSPAAGGTVRFQSRTGKKRTNRLVKHSPGGYGHGRGRPIQSDPISPPFSSFVKPDSHSVGRGRGSLGSDPVSLSLLSLLAIQLLHSRITAFRTASTAFRTATTAFRTAAATALRNAATAEVLHLRSLRLQRMQLRRHHRGSEHISNALGSGAGRGKPFVQNEDNRHIQRSPQPPPQRQNELNTPRYSSTTQLSPEEAGRRARSQLSRAKPPKEEAA